MIRLTADVHRVMKGSCDFRIHVDEQVLLFGKLVVAGCNLCFDPGAELLTNDGVGDIDEPLPWDLVHVTIFRKVVVNKGDLPGSLEDASNAEILVLRSVEDLDVVALDATPTWLTNKDTYYLRLPVTRSLRK